MRLLGWRKLRLSGLGLCVLGCFFGLGFEGLGGLRLWDGRNATLHVDSMLKLLSVMGGFPVVAGFSELHGR